MFSTTKANFSYKRKVKFTYRSYYQIWIGVISALISTCACILVNSSPSDTFTTRLDNIPKNQGKILPEDDATPPILHSSAWEAPLPLEGPVTTAGLEDSPFITPDGNTLFFFFTPSANIPAKDQLNDNVTGIYRSHKSNGKWLEPERLIFGKSGKNALDGCPTFVNDTLWFCSIRAGNYRDIDFWKVEQHDGEWRKLINAGKELNAEIQVGELHITKDGEKVFFHKMDPSGQTGYDIWISQQVNGRWREPEIITILSTSENDSHLGLSPDEKELWFTRTYKGSPAVYRSMLIDGEWQEAELIISQFAGEPSIDEKRNIYFVHHFYKEGKMLEADIYFAKKKGD